MSPRFPQELFDHIIDYAPHERVLRTYSLVCRRWSIQSRSHLFRDIAFRKPGSLDRWCKVIAPTIDGPSRHVKDLHIHSPSIPLAFEPQPLDPYLDHFSAFTRVVNLTLAHHQGKVHLDMLLQCFSASKNSLKCMKLSNSSFGFEETSRIAEFFPNLEVLDVWEATSSTPAQAVSLQPPREASFPRLKALYLYMLRYNLELDYNLLSGFAQASMNLQLLSVGGGVTNAARVQRMIDSSAQSLDDIRIPMLGGSRLQRHMHTVLIFFTARRT